MCPRESSLQLDGPSTSTRWWVAAGACLCLGIGFGCVWLHDPLGIMNDAAQAISAADHLARGEGFRTGILFYEEQYATKQIPAPQTVFPPGYPGLIALVSLTGVPVAIAAYLVVSASFAVSAVLLLLICRRMGLGFAASLMVALGWCGCVQCWLLTRGTMSEMPFILFTLLSLLLFPREYRRADGLLFLSGCAAAAAFSMRYAGVFWFITVAAFCAASLREHFWRSLRAALIWGSAPLLTLGTLFLRNHQHSGEWTGGNAIGSQRSLSFTLYEMYQSVAQLVGWSKGQLLAGGLAEGLAVASIVALGVWLVGNWRRVRLVPEKLPGWGSDPQLALSIGYVVVTLALLVFLDSRTPIGLGPRKVLPLLPFVLIVLAALRSSVAIEGARGCRPLVVPAGLLLLAVMCGQLNVVRQSQERTPVARQIHSVMQTELTETGETLAAYLQSRVTAAAPLLTNEPHQVALQLGRPVLGLPGPEYTDRIWDAAEVRRLVDQYGVRWITVFRAPLRVAVFRSPFLTALDEGDRPEWLTPLAENETVLLFSVASGPSGDAPLMTPTTATAILQTSVPTPAAAGGP